jgi:hypothetical protein
VEEQALSVNSREAIVVLDAEDGSIGDESGARLGVGPEPTDRHTSRGNQLGLLFIRMSTPVNWGASLITVRVPDALISP